MRRTSARSKERGARDLDGWTSRRHATPHTTRDLEIESRECIRDEKLRKLKVAKLVREGRNNSPQNALKFGSDRREYATRYYCRFNKLQKEVDPSLLNQSTRSLSKHFSCSLSTGSDTSTASSGYSRLVQDMIERKGRTVTVEREENHLVKDESFWYVFLPL